MLIGEAWECELTTKLVSPPRSIKSGKVVIILGGRFAGRKGVVVKTFDEGTSERKFGHAIGTSLE